MTLSIMTLIIMTLSIMTLSIMTISIMTLNASEECHCVSFLLNVTIKSNMLGVVLLSAVILSVTVLASCE